MKIDIKDILGVLKMHKNRMVLSINKEELTNRLYKVQGFISGLYYVDVISYKRMNAYDKYFMHLWYKLKENFDYNDIITDNKYINIERRY